MPSCWRRAGPSSTSVLPSRTRTTVAVSGPSAGRPASRIPVRCPSSTHGAGVGVLGHGQVGVDPDEHHVLHGSSSMRRRMRRHEYDASRARRGHGAQDRLPHRRLGPCRARMRRPCASGSMRPTRRATTSSGTGPPRSRCRRLSRLPPMPRSTRSRSRRAGPRRRRRLLVVAAAMVLVVLAGIGVAAVRIAQAQQPTDLRAATEIATNGSDREAFGENLALGNNAGIAAYLVTHPSPPSMRGGTRYFTIERDGTGPGAVDLAPCRRRRVRQGERAARARRGRGGELDRVPPQRRQRRGAAVRPAGGAGRSAAGRRAHGDDLPLPRPATARSGSCSTCRTASAGASRSSSATDRGPCSFPWIRGSGPPRPDPRIHEVLGVSGGRGRPGGSGRRGCTRRPAPRGRPPPGRRTPPAPRPPDPPWARRCRRSSGCP